MISGIVINGKVLKIDNSGNIVVDNNNIETTISTLSNATFDSTTNTLILTKSDNTTLNVDLSSLSDNLNIATLSNATFDSTTNTLILTKSDNTTLNVDLSSLSSNSLIQEPTLSIADGFTINENETVTIAINDYSPYVNYNISCDFGKIVYSGGSSFDYIAQDILDGLDKTDIIYINYKLATIQSNTGSTLINVKYTAIQQDVSIISNDFVLNHDDIAENLIGEFTI